MSKSSRSAVPHGAGFYKDLIFNGKVCSEAHSGTVVSSGRRTYGTSENCMARNGSIAIQGCKVVHASMLVRF